MFNDLPIFLAAAVEGAASSAPAGEGFWSGIQHMLHNFGFDRGVFFAQMVNFLLVVFLIWKFAFKPVLATMDERQKKIADGLQFAEEAKQQLQSAEKEKAEKLREANTQAQVIVHEAKTQAEEFSAKQKSILDLELAEKRRRADEANALERQKVLNEARADIARLVVLTSGKVLGKELSAEEQSRLNASAAREVASAS